MSGKKGPVKPVFFSPGQSVVELDTCSSASALGRPSPPPSPPSPPPPPGPPSYVWDTEAVIAEDDRWYKSLAPSEV
jgi:hypothetical protein